MGSGLTIWFDGECGNDHILGIRYPLGRQDTHSEFHSDADEAQINSILDQSLIELEIIGPKKEDVRRYSALDVPGIKVRLTHLRGALVYELRVPLKKSTDSPFAIEAVSTNRIGVRLETEEFNYSRIKKGLQPNEESGKDSDMESAHLSGGRSESEDSQMESGQHGGRGRHRNIQENKEKSKLLALKLSVQIASAPSAGRK
jgi:hypothetical protein